MVKDERCRLTLQNSHGRRLHFDFFYIKKNFVEFFHHEMLYRNCCLYQVIKTCSLSLVSIQINLKQVFNKNINLNPLSNPFFTSSVY